SGAGRRDPPADLSPHCRTGVTLSADPAPGSFSAQPPKPMIRSPFVVLLTLLFLLVPVSAQEVSRADALDALAEVKRFFRSYSATTERVAAVETLMGMETPEAAAQLLELLSHGDPEVRDAAMGVLASYRKDATFAPLVQELTQVSD